MPLSADDWRYDVIDHLDPVQRLLFEGAPELARAFTHPEDLVKVIVGRTTLGPTTEIGCLAHFLLVRLATDDRALADRLFASVELFLRLITNAKLLIGRALLERKSRSPVEKAVRSERVSGCP